MNGPRPKTFDPNHDRFKRSVKQEKRVAESLGGRTLARSGGLAWSSSDKTTMGGDLKTGELLVEHKRAEPQTKSIGVKREWLQKVTEGAKRQMKIPAMVLTYENASGHEQDWMLLPMPVAQKLLRAYFQEASSDDSSDPAGS